MPKKTRKKESQKEVTEPAFKMCLERLSSQKDAALAADARATTYAGIIIAAAAVLAGLTQKGEPIEMLIGATILVIAAAIAGFAARPVEFYMPGSKFSDFNDDIRQGKEWIETIDELSSLLDENSNENDRIMAKNARILQFSFWIALFGMLVATLPQLL